MKVLSWLSRFFASAFNTVTLLETRRKRRRAKRRARDRHVASALIEAHGRQVLGGPFAGMVYPFAEAAGSALPAKLLGSYEAEAAPFVERICRRAYTDVVNVGCGEGYYAVGLARRLPQARVHAFDIEKRAQRLCAEMARANDVAERVLVKGECTRAKLRALAPADRDRGRTLIVCDCEGGELDLLQPAHVPGLERCDLLVELHDMEETTSTTEVVLERFSDTHSAKLRRHRPCDPAAYPALQILPAAERVHAVDENRSRGRRWAFLQVDDARRSAS